MEAPEPVNRVALLETQPYPAVLTSGALRELLERAQQDIFRVFDHVEGNADYTYLHYRVAVKRKEDWLFRFEGGVFLWPGGEENIRSLPMARAYYPVHLEYTLSKQRDETVPVTIEMFAYANRDQIMRIVEASHMSALIDYLQALSIIPPTRAGSSDGSDNDVVGLS